MSETTQAFGEYLATQAAAADDASAGGPLRQTLGAIAAALRSDSLAEMERYADERGRQRASTGDNLSAVMRSFDGIRGTIWGHLDAFLAEREGWRAADIRAIESVLHVYRNAFLGGFSDTYQEIRRAMAAQAEELEAQRSTIRELSTPILPLFTGVLALPLVGSVDSYRASQVMETLLTAISDQQADIVILDITGVPVVDTGVANYLLQTARAAQLVGAQVVLVGIGAEIAQTLVQLGVDLTQLKVHANLQAGIEYALEALGHKII